MSRGRRCSQSRGEADKRACPRASRVVRSMQGDEKQRPAPRSINPGAEEQYIFHSLGRRRRTESMSVLVNCRRPDFTRRQRWKRCYSLRRSSGALPGGCTAAPHRRKVSRRRPLPLRRRSLRRLSQFRRPRPHLPHRLRRRQSSRSPSWLSGPRRRRSAVGACSLQRGKRTVSAETMFPRIIEVCCGRAFCRPTQRGAAVAGRCQGD